MKLQTLSEGDFTKALARATGMSYGIKSRANLERATPLSGGDFGSRVLGTTYLPTGVPLKQRHRRFFGMGRQFGLVPPNT